MISKKRGCLGLFLFCIISFIILVIIVSFEETKLADKISILAENPENLDSLQKYCLKYRKTYSKILENCNEVLAPVIAAEEEAIKQANMEQAKKDSLAIARKDSLAMEQIKKDSLIKAEISEENIPEQQNVQNTFTDPRDGKKYKTVKIGKQIWMAENLSYNASGSHCYANNKSNCQKYGRLYDWNTAMKSCPSGWYLPSNEEWLTLVYFAGGSEIAGKKLKAKSGWIEEGNDTDEFGFSALPGGRGYPDGSFDYVGYYGYWWSASVYKSIKYKIINAYNWNMAFNDEYAGMGDIDKSALFSVRCFQKDSLIKAEMFEENIPKQQNVQNTFTDPRDGKKYKTVKIGKQIWMAENLSYNASGSHCYANNLVNNKSYCQKYGRLYDLNTAMKSCPSGWHLPSGKEWQALVDFAGGDKVAGAKLKASSGWDTKEGNGTDEFGFSALPGGHAYSDGGFGEVGCYGRWWSAKEGGGEFAYHRYMFCDDIFVDKSYRNKSNWYSVRCVKD
jgi:uncharacterized protein (TIGR02145 family)